MLLELLYAALLQYFCQNMILALESWHKWNSVSFIKEFCGKDEASRCEMYEVDGARPRGRPRKTWREIVEKDCQAHKLNKEDVVDRKRWRKQIKND